MLPCAETASTPSGFQNLKLYFFASVDDERTFLEKVHPALLLLALGIALNGSPVVCRVLSQMVNRVVSPVVNGVVIRVVSRVESRVVSVEWGVEWRVEW